MQSLTICFLAHDRSNRLVQQYAYANVSFYNSYLKVHLDEVERRVAKLEDGLPDHTPKLSAEDAKIRRSRWQCSETWVSWENYGGKNE